MMPPGYFDAHNETAVAMNAVAGLALAMNGLLSDWQDVNMDTPANRALRALAGVLAEKAQGLAAAHEAEWETIRQSVSNP